MTCPRCHSPAPHLHPAVQHEGEVQPCAHDFHKTVTPQNTPKRIAATQEIPRLGRAMIRIQVTGVLQLDTEKVELYEAQSMTRFEALSQATQDELGHTGLLVTEVEETTPRPQRRPLVDGGQHYA